MNIIERLKELQAVATPGPWEINYSDVGDEEYIEVPGGITAKNGFRVVSEECGLCDVQQAWTVEEFESNAELIVTLRNALPDLIAVAEAAGEYISKRVEYAGYERQYEILKRVENKTTMQEMEMSTVDAERERAELELCDAWDNLNAALTKLEVDAHED